MESISCNDPSHAALAARLDALEARAVERDAAHAREVAALKARITELEARLGRDSSNSSRPPSSDPPWKRGKRRADGKGGSGRKPGGQPGHEGAARDPVPPEQVDEFVRHELDACPGCGGHDLEETSVFAHQVTELPPIRPTVTEHQVVGVRCRDCGAEAAGDLPPEIAASQFGPRVHAFVAAFTGGLRLTHREVARAFDEFFGISMGVGTVTPMQRRVLQAIEWPFREAQRAIREGPFAYVDETSWRLRRERAYLWSAHRDELVIYHVDRRRNRAAFRRLMAGKFHGVRIVDRYAVHDCVPDAKRQVCLAHLLRDFEGHATGPQGGRMFGRRGKAILKRVFRAWWQFTEGRIDRSRLQEKCARLEERMKALLDEGAEHAHAKVRGFARKVRKQRACLFTFASFDGIGPTSNPAERMLRPAVLWRKGSFGSHSEAGARFVSRIMTVTRSLRLQGRDVLDFLVDALHAHHHGHDPPSLLPAASPTT